ncbi:MAG: hypothetical protein ACE366_25370 [Bradymonadia bacterium]
MNSPFDSASSQVPRRPHLSRWLPCLCFALWGCLPDDPPEVLSAAPQEGTGPMVVFEMKATPIPDVPFPNDLLTRPDPDSTTGLRLNLSIQAPTAANRSMRRRLLELDGFGLSGQITVRFDAPVDVTLLRGVGRAYVDDPLWVIDLTEGAHFGERIPLDLGRGNFPLVVHDPDGSFPRDPRAGEPNLIFETVAEDLDGDGQLGPLEDGDGDGVLDQPNVFSEGGDSVDDLVDFYEKETDTLILRPVVPLRPGHTYAVVITDQVRGVDGQPVRSPFPFIHHSRQFATLKALPQALADHGLDLQSVAFTWAFTTQTATRALLDLRHGLVGQGPFEALEDVFPPGVTAIEVLKDQGTPEPLLLRTEDLESLLDAAGEILLGGTELERAGVRQAVSTIDYLVSARFVAPDLLIEEPEVDENGLIVTQAEGNFAPAPIFRLDTTAMTVEASAATVPLWCAVPKATDVHQAPFPVVMYQHSLGATGFELIRVAGPLTAGGFAVCSIDAYGHGAVLSDAETQALETALEPLGMAPFISAFMGLRARDLNNDGVLDPGAGTFTADPFRTRDVLRQGVVDALQTIRVLQGFDGFAGWAPAQGGGAGALAGDFNGDGVVDFGGPGVTYAVTGQGYGAMVASMVGAVAPEIDATALISGGGGLTDIGTRTQDRSILLSAVAQIMGPLIIGDPPESNFTALRFWVPDEDAPRAAFARLPPLVPGDMVRLVNLTSGEAQTATVDGEGGFHITVAADAVRAPKISATLAKVRNQRQLAETPPYTLDADEVTAFGDPLALEVVDVNGNLKHRVDALDSVISHNGLIYPAGSPLVAIEGGMGLRRQTPELRRFLMLYQTAVDPGDPLIYARAHLLEPRELVSPAPLTDPMAAPPTPTPGSTENSPLMILATAGDSVLPVSSAVALGRAAGVVSIDEPLDDHNGRTPNEVLIDYRVVEGVPRLERYEGGGLFDVDDLSDGTDGFELPRLDPPLRWSVETPGVGTSSIRVPVLDPEGSHGLTGPRPDLPWDGPTALLEMMVEFFQAQ